MFSARFKWNLETNRLAQLLAAKKKAGAPILDLTESNPTRAGFIYPSDTILAALADPLSLRYEPEPFGLLSARQAVADYYGERGQAIEAGQICLTASTSEAYSWLFKLLTDQGDNVLIPQPGYPLFDFLAALEGVELRPYQLAYRHPAGWEIDFDSIRLAMNSRTRAVIIVSPNNPTGSFIRQAEFDRLDELCAAHKLALLVDEVFSDFVIEPEKTATPELFNSSALTFVMNGFSKTLGLPQMKLGWVVTSGPEELKRSALERLELIADTFLSVNTPVQRAVPAWLKLRRTLQAQIVDRVRKNYGWLVQRLHDSPGRVLAMEAGWSAVIEVPRIQPEEEWVLRLLAESDVLVHPGYFFDFPREAFLIVSLLPEPEILEQGIAALLKQL